MPPSRDEQNFLDLTFPTKGLDLSRGYSFQPPGTTAIGANVRGFDALAQRMRGGSRPGLSKYVLGQVPGTSVLQELTTVVGVGFTPPGPPTQVTQMSPVAPAATSATSVTFQIPTTAGNSILVLGGGAGGGYSVSDGSNTYTRINNGSVSGVFAQVFLATNIVSVSSVTVTPNAANTVWFVIAELGPNVGHQGGGSGAQSGTGNVNGAVGDWTPLHSPDIIYTLCVTDNGNNIVTRNTGTGWIDLTTGTTNLAVALQYSSSLASKGAATWSWGHSSDWQSLSGEVEL